MSQETPTPEKYSPEDALPEVTPPSAGFILQLFVIPAAIVMVIIMVWLLFSWLAQMGDDPKSYVEDIQKGKENSWQLAYNLSTELHGNPTYRNDLELSNKLAEMLEERIHEPLPTKERGRDNEIRLREYLVRCLGAFEVADRSVPALLAASTAGGEQELKVRLASYEAIALLAGNVGGEQLASQSEPLVPMLLEASESDDQAIAERGVFTLAVVGGPQAKERLKEVVGGAGLPSVRYNAATGLARSGDELAIPVLIEMLNPENLEGIKAISDKDQKTFQQALILLNALRACRQLAQKNSSADLSALQQAVEKTVNADLVAQIKHEAADVLDKLKERNVQAAEASNN